VEEPGRGRCAERRMDRLVLAGFPASPAIAAAKPRWSRVWGVAIDSGSQPVVAGFATRRFAVARFIGYGRMTGTALRKYANHRASRGRSHGGLTHTQS